MFHVFLHSKKALKKILHVAFWENKAWIKYQAYIQALKIIFFCLNQVSDQVLTDQMQNTINQMVRSFIDLAENFILVRLNALRALNGDLQALLLVSSTRRVHLTKELHRALLVVKARLEQASAIINEAISGKKLFLYSQIVKIY